MTTIAERLQAARRRICDAALSAGRDPDSIQLLAVSKTKPLADIYAAYDAGQRAFGENYVQEAVDKIAAFKRPDVQWHLIGPLQSNKTRIVAEHFDWVQSLDRERIAIRLDEQRPAHLNPIQICIQVNVSGETSKSGLALDQVEKLAQKVDELPNLTLRGLMAIPKADDDPDRQRAAFATLRHAYEKLKRQYETVDTLSMGMSNDLEAAIMEGATLVRLGTAIFGARQTKG
ncbi:YggS family pyridoxal phosphate-dependent enzyme [Gallaecimonas sp. GXIMD4217]|uniref:YggS family pyridoxal phosphate-dependent enzyme n=1 Tax=Gallaecimonas sp. GXIMD4217 TaxID=3131927 RepID=UPI00311B189E